MLFDEILRAYQLAHPLSLPTNPKPMIAVRPRANGVRCAKTKTLAQLVAILHRLLRSETALIVRVGFSNPHEPRALTSLR
jgi:hypothetical protein